MKQIFLLVFQMSSSSIKESLYKPQKIDCRLNFKSRFRKKMFFKTMETIKDSPKSTQKQVAKELGCSDFTKKAKEKI